MQEYKNALDGLLRGKTLKELAVLHSQLLLAIARRFGTSQAIHIVGSSLQWLSTVCSDGRAAEIVLLERREEPRCGVEHTDSRLAIVQRWKTACQKALLAPDPWAPFGLRKLPLERAQRRRWDLRTRAWSTAEILVRMEQQPFANGSMRLCYRMRAEPAGLNWVAKRYESELDLVATLEADVVMQLRAKEFAELFNACLPPKPVDFVEASIVQLLGRPSGNSSFAVETFLVGSFAKHSSNSGFVADDVVRHTPHAFSHFTFEASRGEEIVVDIQGVDDLYTDPQIHTGSGVRFGRGNMGIRGIALFFASHRCNSVCRQLGLTHFEHAPMAGDGAAATEWQSPKRQPIDGSGHNSLCPTELALVDESVITLTQVRAQAQADIPGKQANAKANDQSIYAGVHFALSILHARHVQSGDQFIGHNVLASPAQGLFHLRTAAHQGSVPAMLALACLHLNIRPRKGVLRALSTNLQQPLPVDPAMALPYIVRAAERGVVSAMAAAGHAYAQGQGCIASASRAARWYRAVLSERSARTPAEQATEEEEDGERLPGGGVREHELLAALAALYEAGGDALTRNTQLAWQFNLLARSSARRDEDAQAESGSNEDA